MRFVSPEIRPLFDTRTGNPTELENAVDLKSVRVSKTTWTRATNVFRPMMGTTVGNGARN